MILLSGYAGEHQIKYSKCEDIASTYKDAKKIILIMDNLNTPLYETFLLEKAKALWNRFEFVLSCTRKLAEYGGN